MGSAYARIVSQQQDPAVALLSNGTEAQKGPPRVVEAHAAAARASPGLHFIGNIEGVDIPKGTADVVVCDGFVGNVCLKMLEGVSETVVELARYAYKERLLWRAGLAMLLGRHRAPQGGHRLGAVRRRAAARLRPALHQGPRPLEGAGHHQRGQGRGQGGGATSLSDGHRGRAAAET